MVNLSEGAAENYLVVCFEEPHFGIILLYSLMSLCILVVVPANAWCLWFRLTVERRSKPAPVFSLNLTVIEMMFCVECLLEMLDTFVFKDAGLYPVIFFFFGITWTGRPLLQACICVERYVAVVHPLTFLRLRGMRCRVCAAAACWSMGAGYGLYLAYNNKFPDVIFISVFFVAVSVISFCCASVLCALRSPGPGDRHTGGDQGGTDAGGNLQKRNAFNIIFRVLMVTLLTYLPQIILMFLVLNIKTVFCLCDLSPSLTSLYVLDVAITPLLKIYKAGYLHLKRLDPSNS